MRRSRQFGELRGDLHVVPELGRFGRKKTPTRWSGLIGEQLFIYSKYSGSS